MAGPAGARLWRIEASDAVKTVFTAEELAGLVSQARTEGLLDAEEHARITGALALHSRTAADALQPWSTVTTVAEDVSPASLEVLATRTGRSRFPVVQRSTRRVLGFVHVKDVLGYAGQGRRSPVAGRRLPPAGGGAAGPYAGRAAAGHAPRAAAHGAGQRRPRPLGVVTLDDVLTAIVG